MPTPCSFWKNIVVTMFRNMLEIVLHADNFELLAQRVHADSPSSRSDAFAMSMLIRDAAPFLRGESIGTWSVLSATALTMYQYS